MAVSKLPTPGNNILLAFNISFGSELILALIPRLESEFITLNILPPYL
jgi:hypothetical protein